MRVITFACRKGGVGKTTLAGHLAVEAERQGDGPVALADFDPQGSLAAWWNLRRAEHPSFAALSPESIGQDLDRLAKIGVRLVLIDTPPNLAPAVTHAVAHANLVLVPLRPSPHDLRSLGATVALVESMKKPFFFILNAAIARSRMRQDIRVPLGQWGPVAHAEIGARLDFVLSMIDGRTACEIEGADQSRAEIAELWREVRSRLIDRDRPTDTIPSCWLPTPAAGPPAAQSQTQGG